MALCRLCRCVGDIEENSGKYGMKKERKGSTNYASIFIDVCTGFLNWITFFETLKKIFFRFPVK